MNHPFSDRIEVINCIAICGTHMMHACVGVGRITTFSSG